MPTTFNTASTRLVLLPGAYIQLFVSVFALRTFKDKRLEGWAIAYACTSFLILTTVLAAFFNVVCLRTGMCLNKSAMRTLVPTGCDARWVLHRSALVISIGGRNHLRSSPFLLYLIEEPTGSCCNLVVIVTPRDTSAALASASPLKPRDFPPIVLRSSTD